MGEEIDTIIPYEIYSVCKGMREVVLTNLGIWVREEDVMDVYTVVHMNDA